MTKIEKFANIYESSVEELTKLKYKKVVISDIKKDKFIKDDLVYLYNGENSSSLSFFAKLESGPLINKLIATESLIVYRK